MSSTAAITRRPALPFAVQLLAAPVVLFAAVYLTIPLGALPVVRTSEDPATPVWVGVLVVGLFWSLTLVLAVLGVILLARLDGGLRLRDVVGHRGSARVGRPFGTGLTLAVAATLVVGVALTAGGVVPVEAVDLGGLPLWAVIVIGLLRAFVLQALPEELIFRGYLLTVLRRRLTPTTAVALSAAVFALIHLTSTGGQQGWVERIVYLALPFGFGLAAGALRMATGSLWAAVGVHGGFHVALLLSALLAPTWPWLAIGNGPALWLVLGAVFTALGFVALSRAASAGRPADQNAMER